MKKPILILLLSFLFTLTAITINGCSVSTVPSPYMDENSYLPSVLKIVHEQSNLQFKAANNDNYVYLSIIIKTDSLERIYSNSIINLWLNSEGLHAKDSGFQFPLKKQAHPFLKNQFSTLTNWGGFKSVLTTAQEVRLKERISDAEGKILYFNKKNARIESVEADGSRGFRLDKIISKDNIQLNFVIPLNADFGDRLGFVGSVKSNLSIGFEILPGYNIFRSNVRSLQPLNSPGLGRPLQQTRRSPGLQPRTGRNSEIYWLDLTLSHGES